MRAFIALEVPEEIKEKIEELQKEFGSEGIVLVKKEAMHITLQFLGNIGEVDVAKVREAMQEIGSAPFEVRLVGLSCFTPEFIKVVFAKVTAGSEELVEIYKELADALKEKGLAFEKEEYIPHLTLARVKRVRNKDALVSAINKHSALDLGSFTASGISLKESILTPEGPVYNTLYELKL